MQLKIIFSTIIISLILAFALILAAIPIIATSASAIVHEGQMEEHQGKNMIHSQDQSAASTSMLERGDVAMGFNQSKISHQFKSTLTGGEILITALNNSDTETIKQIKKHISIIQNIRNLLEQLSDAYKTENYQKASELAITAYIDNYEYIETPLEITGNGDLMKELELKMRVDLREAIKEKVSQNEIDKLIDDINTKLFDVAIILDPR